MPVDFKCILHRTLILWHLPSHMKDPCVVSWMWTLCHLLLMHWRKLISPKNTILQEAHLTWWLLQARRRFAVYFYWYKLDSKIVWPYKKIIRLSEWWMRIQLWSSKDQRGVAKPLRYRNICLTTVSMKAVQSTLLSPSREGSQPSVLQKGSAMSGIGQWDLWLAIRYITRKFS